MAIGLRASNVVSHRGAVWFVQGGWFGAFLSPWVYGNQSLKSRASRARGSAVDLVWKFDRGEAKTCPLEALYTAPTSTLRLPVEVDCKDALQGFARQCALDVVGLWNAPEVVQRYLETGDASIAGEAALEAWLSYRSITKEVHNYPTWYPFGSVEREAAVTAVRAAHWATSSVSAGSVARLAVLAATGGGTRTSTQAFARVAARVVASVVPKDAALVAAGETLKHRHRVRLCNVLAQCIFPVSTDLQQRLGEYRRIRYESPHLLPLYLGQWWCANLCGLELVEI